MTAFCGLGVVHRGVLRRVGSVGWSFTACELGAAGDVSVGGAGGGSSGLSSCGAAIGVT